MIFGNGKHPHPAPDPASQRQVSPHAAQRELAPAAGPRVVLVGVRGVGRDGGAVTVPEQQVDLTMLAHTNDHFKYP